METCRQGKDCLEAWYREIQSQWVTTSGIMQLTRKPADQRCNFTTTQLEWFFLIY